jgi:hypothetical protein
MEEVKKCADCKVVTMLVQASMVNMLSSLTFHFYILMMKEVEGRKLMLTLCLYTQRIVVATYIHFLFLSYMHLLISLLEIKKCM